MLSLLLTATLLLLWALPVWRDMDALRNAALRMVQGDLGIRVRLSRIAGIRHIGETFNQMASRISALIENQRSMTNAVSHELRTPLARLSFELDLLAREEAAPKRGLIIQDMHADIEELQGMVAELLVYARLERPAEESVKLETVDTLDWLKRWRWSPSRPRPATCNATSRKATRTTSICIRATSRAAEPGAERRALCRRARARLGHGCPEGGFQLIVDDDGPGIPAAERENIFEPFIRLDDSRDRGTGGAGLGWRSSSGWRPATMAASKPAPARWAALRVALAGRDKGTRRRLPLRTQTAAEPTAAAARTPPSTSTTWPPPSGGADGALQVGGLVLHGAGRRRPFPSAAFCCVTSSICDTARLTCSMPSACSGEAAAISPMMSVTRCTEATMSHGGAGALRAVRTLADLADGVLDQALISLAACAAAPGADLGGDHREALPCSPARASTAAFSARMLVWKAMPSITDTMSAIFTELAEIALMAPTTSDTVAPPPCRGRRRQLVGLARAVGVLLDGGGQLLHGRRRLFQRRGLLLGARRQVGIAGGDLARGRGDVVHAGADPGDGGGQVAVHRLQGPHQLADLVTRAHGDVAGQVIGRHGARHRQRIRQRMRDAAGQQHRQPLSKPMAPITIIHRLALAYSPWISWARASISARCTLDSSRSGR